MENFKVYWNNLNKKTFTYGSVIKMCGGVDYTNYQVPSGVSLHQWTMVTNFYKDRTSPSLPILKHEKSYKIIFDLDCIPVHSVYFKITFYRRNHSIIDTLIISPAGGQFVYPRGTFFYTIDAMSASVEHLSFRNMEIRGEEIRDISNAYEVYENVNRRYEVYNEIKN